MYYSYVEIEYVATSFSPARTDLALKLLRLCHLISPVELAFACRWTYFLWYKTSLYQNEIRLLADLVGLFWLSLHIHFHHIHFFRGHIIKQGSTQQMIINVTPLRSWCFIAFDTTNCMPACLLWFSIRKYFIDESFPQSILLNQIIGFCWLCHFTMIFIRFDNW